MYPFNVEMYTYIHSNIHIHKMNVFYFSSAGPIFKFKCWVHTTSSKCIHAISSVLPYEDCMYSRYILLIHLYKTNVVTYGVYIPQIASIYTWLYPYFHMYLICIHIHKVNVLNIFISGGHFPLQMCCAHHN